MMTLEEQVAAAAARAAAAAIRAELREHVDGDGQLLVSTTEAARRLCVSPDTVRRMVHVGDLDAVHGVGRGMKVPVESLRRLVNDRTRNATDTLRAVS